MKALIIFLFLPLVYAETGPDCGELKGILQNLQKNLEASVIEKNCDRLDAKKLLEGKVTPSERQIKLLKDVGCQNLSTIDLKLSSAENELALYSGIDSLKEEVKASAEKVKLVKPEAIQTAAQDFVQNLAIAQTLELMVNTTGKTGQSYLSEISKTDLKDWDSLEKFKKLTANYCKKDLEKTLKKDEITVCSEHFVPTQEAYDEILAFVETGKKTEQKFNKGQVADLKDALKIQLGDKASSYTQIRMELGDPTSETILSKENITQLKLLPPINDAKKFQFLSKMKEAKSGLDVKSVSSRFDFYLKDLKDRQQWEMQSKFSLLKYEYNEFIPENKMELCNVAIRDVTKALECMESITNSPKILGSKKSHVLNMMEQFKASKAHLDNLIKDQSECKVEADLKIPATCQTDTKARQIELQDDSLLLNALKAKILEDKEELIKFRNLAIEKFQTQKCSAPEDSRVGDCYANINSTLPKEALVLTQDILDIAIVYQKPAEEIDYKKLCDDSTAAFAKKNRLCLLTDDQTSNKVEVENDDDYMAPNDVLNARDPVLEAGAIGAANILRNALNTWANGNYNPYGHYPYNAYPSNPYGSTASVALSQALAGGYGFYGSTPNLMPYSSFGTGYSSFTPFASDYNSTYFGGVVGW